MSLPATRISAYLAWWLADIDIERGDREHETMPPFAADSEAHDACRDLGYLVFDVRDRCHRWWLTEAGENFARANPPPPPPGQLGLFEPNLIRATNGRRETMHRSGEVVEREPGFCYCDDALVGHERTNLCGEDGWRDP